MFKRSWDFWNEIARIKLVENIIENVLKRKDLVDKKY